MAGYYAAHRRSDDLDLFSRDAISHKAMVLAVRSLRDMGVELADERSSAQFHHAMCHFENHHFTVQVVLDSNLFRIGSAVRATDGVLVADLGTLVKLKAATLVSRGSEKDLYDLMWLFDQKVGLDVGELIALGAQVDAGMNAEAVLANLVGTRLRRSACGFSVSQSQDEVWGSITRFQKNLAGNVEAFLRGQPALPIAKLIRKLK